ncbi:hypothetical protein [Endozoicomonas sp. ALD040]|uniref:hypothetical protein n=1 Tax=unclassified Endozoicomonas TaxID=2644528 RepID=UPI003BB08131
MCDDFFLSWLLIGKNILHCLRLIVDGFSKYFSIAWASLIERLLTFPVSGSLVLQKSRMSKVMVTEKQPFSLGIVAM